MPHAQAWRRTGLAPLVATATAPVVRGPRGLRAEKAERGGLREVLPLDRGCGCAVTKGL